MKLGFSGSRNGMTRSQRAMLGSWMSLWLTTNEIYEVHHGTCVGADDQFHQLCKWFGLRIILHPPSKPDLTVTQHYLDVPEEDIRPALDYLPRNDRIVAECDHRRASRTGHAQEVSREADARWLAENVERRVLQRSSEGHRSIQSVPARQRNGAGPSGHSDRDRFAAKFSGATEVAKQV